MACYDDPNQYYGCADGYNYNYNQCCDTESSMWVSILIWTSAALLYILCCSLLMGGAHYRRRRYRNRQAQYSHMDTLDSMDDSYYDELNSPRRRQQPATRVVYVQQAPQPAGRQ